jgi:VanZ family protein
LGRGFSRSIGLAVIVLVVVYGSLYPFAFRQPANGVGPIGTLIRDWGQLPKRGDFISNVLLYLPLGFFGVLALAEKMRALPALGLAVLMGALLSTAMELAQYYVAGRVTAASNVYSDVIGTALGAAAATLSSGHLRWQPLREVAANRVPAFLLAIWLGYRLFPYVPTIDLHKYWIAIRPVLLNPIPTKYDLFRYTAVWLAIGVLVEALAGTRWAWLFFPLFTASVLAAKVLIVGKTLSAAELTGAGLALGLWLILTASVGARFRVIVIALLFGASIVVERLAPFQFASHGRHFGWIPFLGLMRGSLELNIMSFLEKAFLYGSLIWLLGQTGLRFWTSTLLVAIMLFATSWAEAHLPGRSAEITDALIALLMGAIIASMETEGRAATPLGIGPGVR